MTQQSGIQLYYWQVTFANGKKISQFDEKGNELLIKDICPKECLYVDPQDNQVHVNRNSRVFENFEKSFGRVINIAWIPFTESLAKAVMQKQPHVRIAGGNEVKPISMDCPLGYFAGAPYKISAVQFGIQTGEDRRELKLIPIDVLVSKIVITMVPYDKEMQIIRSEFDVVYQ